MNRTAKLANQASVICFALSSASLLLIPFLEIGEELPRPAYWIAGIFWGGLLAGILLQITAAAKSRDAEKKPCRKARLMLIPAAVFALLLIVILLMQSKSVILLSADLALLLMSVELYFYLRRRDRI
ncbi:MAG: hypothetical protein J6Z45_04675 [Oscillospiraceae bacterium]|nr:hypothetical protein [Oscillospiraceae bacterium]